MGLDSYPSSVVSSSRDPYNVTPDDNNDLPTPARALLIANAGVIVVVTAAGNTATLTVPAGQLNGQVKRVKSTNTTATGITALP